MENQNVQVRILGLPIEWKAPQDFLDQIDIFLEQNTTDHIALLTVPALLEAVESDSALTLLREADLLIPAEAEILSQIREGDCRTYVEDALYLLFSRFTEQHSKVMVLEDSQQDAEQVKKLLSVRYPELEILGCEGTANLDETGVDHIINEINSNEIDLVVSSLLGSCADHFMREHKSKITSNIWISLGGHRKLQSEIGIKIGKMKSLSTTMNWNSLLRTQFEKIILPVEE